MNVSRTIGHRMICQLGLSWYKLAVILKLRPIVPFSN